MAHVNFYFPLFLTSLSDSQLYFKACGLRCLYSQFSLPLSTITTATQGGGRLTDGHRGRKTQQEMSMGMQGSFPKSSVSRPMRSDLQFPIDYYLRKGVTPFPRGVPENLVKLHNPQNKFFIKYQGFSSFKTEPTYSLNWSGRYEPLP